MRTLALLLAGTAFGMIVVLFFWGDKAPNILWICLMVVAVAAGILYSLASEQDHGVSSEEL